MFDDIPAQLWILLATAAVAYTPARYVYRYATDSPSSRDVTLPADDFDWRSRRLLARNGAVLVCLVAFACFIFTPTAEEFARSPTFWPILIAGLGAAALFTVQRSLATGRVEPLVRGFNSTYDRTTQPKRFWASLAWNAVMGCGLIWMSIVTIGSELEEECIDRSETRSPKESIVACDGLLKNGDNSGHDRANLLFARGFSYHEAGDYKRAASDYSEAIQLDPSDSYSLYNRAIIREATGDQYGALADYTASIRVRADNADAYVNRGRLMLNLGQDDAAIENFTRANEIEPRNPNTLADRGMAYAWKNDRVRAERDFKAALAIDLANPVPLRGYALLSMNVGDMNKAIQHLNEALTRDPTDKWSLEKRAQAYGALGDAEKSEADVRELARLDKKS